MIFRALETLHVQRKGDNKFVVLVSSLCVDVKGEKFSLRLGPAGKTSMRVSLHVTSQRNAGTS